MGGGGSSSGTSIQPITTDQLKQFYGFQSGQFGKYKQDQPLLKSAETNALGFNNQLFGAGSPLQNLWSLSDAEKRNVDQSTLTGGGAGSDYGMANSKGTVASEVLGREDFMLQRAGQLQGLATGGLNQEIGVQGAETGTFSQLMNPILQVPMANLQGQIAGAQISQQASAAGSSKAGGAASGIGSIVGAVLPIVASAFSDERLKENIKKTGLKTKDGIPLKTFSYRGDKRRYLGAMAQDVEKVHPEAVNEDLMSGFKFVDLSKAGVPMAQLG